ncbi:MAG: hypothetical protein AAGF15_03965 [Pseudomonadota bacterium]
MKKFFNPFIFSIAVMFALFALPILLMFFRFEPRGYVQLRDHKVILAAAHRVSALSVEACRTRKAFDPAEAATGVYFPACEGSVTFTLVSDDETFEHVHGYVTAGYPPQWIIYPDDANKTWVFESCCGFGNDIDQATIQPAASRD